MRPVRALLFAIGLVIAPAAVAAPDNEAPIVVEGVTAKTEIERILKADNLDTELLNSRDVADTLTGIARGRAPDDFWTAYQAHVRAWRALAEAEDGADRAGDDADALSYIAMAIGRSKEQIERTFDDVERIARQYGARLPVPPYELRRTT